ncbi:MAG TPA: hypothetical protein VJ794_11830 [Gemmatimonadales bacterium]|nr:hypothetical protein [Gemmatimonadales bacterium]
MSRQIILEVDAATAKELESVAPARDRRRSDFLRRALRRALDEEIEGRIREAYRRQPDDAGAAYFDPAAWEPVPARSRRKRRS